MARKTLLTESEIRNFMKLANIEPLQEMGYDMPGMRDEEEEKMEESVEELEEEEGEESRVPWTKPLTGDLIEMKGA